ncbi:unnamed protein product [Larinioides sclopetarius]|uniref:Uncharacterized protein n=1 Tax=Larinioides sclopetarius TaxID=280406 RepID=A0AAV1ZWF4_9ARAC
MSRPTFLISCKDWSMAYAQKSHVSVFDVICMCHKDKLPTMSMCHNEGHPSLVANRKWLHCCSPKTFPFDPYNIGVWMMLCDDVHPDPDSTMTEIDVAWAKTKELVFSSIVPIIKAKCTTKSTRPTSLKLATGGAILFYTPDFRNKKEVATVAEAIHDHVNSKKELFFRAYNANSFIGQSSLGEKSVCMYMYTVNKMMLVKREEEIFMLLD